MKGKQVVLLILDGWGLAVPGPGNAVSRAKTPNMTYFAENYAQTQLIAHGESVGLPKNDPGNTETGHLNIGAGSIVYQDLPRINISIADGSFFQNEMISGAFKHIKQNDSALHIMGLVGGGGVHSDISHLFALLRLCHEQQVDKVYLHLFTDGRDSPPNAAMNYINQIQKVMDREGVGKIASIMGRYYAMDRDFRWDRTAKAYFCLTHGQGKKVASAAQAIEEAYAHSQTDEFIEPTITNQFKPISDHDAAIFYNFRIDRPRQLTKAFVLDDFVNLANESDFDPYAVKYNKTHIVDDKALAKAKPFDRERKLQDLYFVTLTQYEKSISARVAFPPQEVNSPLGEVLSKAGFKQLRIAESEKERFVTYYFNGQREEPYQGEDRLIVSSPKVSTYDKKPEMATYEITAEAVAAIKQARYDVIVINFANPDMVGHTGNIKAAIQACSVADECVGKIAKEVLAQDGIMFITADHGNAEEMINLTTSTVDTEHNANPVPLIVVGNTLANHGQLPQGILADIAPTLLSVLNIPIPFSMTGRNLLR